MQRFESSAFQAHISCPRTDVQLVRQGAVLTVSLSYRGAYGMGEKYDALNQKGESLSIRWKKSSASKVKNILPGAVLLDRQRIRPVC